jgi:RHS repeat-associated protein
VQDVTQTNTTNEAHGAAEGPQRETTRSVSGLGEVGVPERRSAGPALHGRNTGSSAHPKQRFFVPFQGRILAEYYGGSTRGTLFDHPDELGSLTTATDYATSHSAERLLYPFGELWQGSDLYSLGMHQTFAQLPDYDNDSNSDLYNTLNRHYTPMGRWLSPDPGGLKVVRFDDPQTWNMYAYVRNNPTTLTDPSGLIDFGGWLYQKWAALLKEPPPPPRSLVQPPRPLSGEAKKALLAGLDSAKVGKLTVAQAAQVLSNESRGLTGGKPGELAEGKTAEASAIINNASLSHPHKMAPATGTATTEDRETMREVYFSRATGGNDPAGGRTYFGNSQYLLTDRDAGNGLPGAAGRQTVYLHFGPFDWGSNAPQYIYIYNDPGH